jgi:hypothetical protein
MANTALLGLQVCNISDITYDRATDPKEGGFGNLTHAAPHVCT